MQTRQHCRGSRGTVNHWYKWSLVNREEAFRLDVGDDDLVILVVPSPFQKPPVTPICLQHLNRFLLWTCKDL